MEDKGCYDIGAAQENPSTNSYTFEFHKSKVNGAGGNAHQQQRQMLGARTKPTPSKWDDAQKWLVGLSGGDRDHARSKNNKPRNSNADDRRLLGSSSQKGRDSCASADGDAAAMTTITSVSDDGEVKKIECDDESVWRVGKPMEDSPFVIRSVCVRDMGTEMTPIASQEPSRHATPLRATTPVSSRSSTPGRRRQGEQSVVKSQDRRHESSSVLCGMVNGNVKQTFESNMMHQQQQQQQVGSQNSLESRAMAWDEAEKAKYMARYKREEVKIQAWENHEKRKAEMEMRRMEVKAERLKIRAQEKLANKLAVTRRIAEEKRANAEAKLNERAARTSERADYIRRTGHLPFSFSFKMPSLCG